MIMDGEESKLANRLYPVLIVECERKGRDDFAFLNNIVSDPTLGGSEFIEGAV